MGTVDGTPPTNHRKPSGAPFVDLTRAVPSELDRLASNQHESPILPNPPYRDFRTKIIETRFLEPRSLFMIRTSCCANDRTDDVALSADETTLGGKTDFASSVDLPRIESAVREILIAIGEDPDRPGLLDTPRRVASAYEELFGGIGVSPATHLARQFEQDGEDPVIVTDIAFTSMCEHHLLPFSGVAHIAYQPQHGRVVGLSKLARTVEILARRPQQQERLTRQIRLEIEKHLDPAGVLVMVEATHSCMQIRGVKARGASMKTRSAGGRWERDNATRREIQAMMART